MGTNPHFVSKKNIENKTIIPINAPISQHKSLGTLNMTQFHSTTYLACIMAPILFMENKYYYYVLKQLKWVQLS